MAALSATGVPSLTDYIQAWSTFVAVLLSLSFGVGPVIWKWLQRPRLRILPAADTFSDFDEHERLVEESICLEVQNVGRQEAQDVRVYATRLWERARSEEDEVIGEWSSQSPVTHQLPAYADVYATGASELNLLPGSWAYVIVSAARAVEKSRTVRIVGIETNYEPAPSPFSDLDYFDRRFNDFLVEIVAVGKNAPIVRGIVRLRWKDEGGYMFPAYLSYWTPSKGFLRLLHLRPEYAEQPRARQKFGRRLKARPHDPKQQRTGQKVTKGLKPFDYV